MSDPTNKDIIDVLADHRRYAVEESVRVEKNFGKINGRLDGHSDDISDLVVDTATLSTRQKFIGGGVGTALAGVTVRLVLLFFGI